MGCLCRNFYMLSDRQFEYTLVLLYICVKTHNVHRNKKCSVFHICLFSERYDFCDFDIGCSSVSTNFVKHRTRLGHPLFLSPFTVVRPNQIFGILGYQGLLFRDFLWFFLGFFFQSDRPTQYQETHWTVNKEKKGDGLRGNQTSMF